MSKAASGLAHLEAACKELVKKPCRETWSQVQAALFELLPPHHDVRARLAWSELMRSEETKTQTIASLRNRKDANDAKERILGAMGFSMEDQEENSGSRPAKRVAPRFFTVVYNGKSNTTQLSIPVASSKLPQRWAQFKAGPEVTSRIPEKCHSLWNMQLQAEVSETTPMQVLCDSYQIYFLKTSASEEIPALPANMIAAPAEKKRKPAGDVESGPSIRTPEDDVQDIRNMLASKSGPAALAKEMGATNTPTKRFFEDPAFTSLRLSHEKDPHYLLGNRIVNRKKRSISCRVCQRYSRPKPAKDPESQSAHGARNTTNHCGVCRVGLCHAVRNFPELPANLRSKSCFEVWHDPTFKPVFRPRGRPKNPTTKPVVISKNIPVKASLVTPASSK